MITKHTHTTQDEKGTEFSYTCYVEKDHYLNPETQQGEEQITRLYVCNEFPEVTANTLQELKTKMTNL